MDRSTRDMGRFTWRPLTTRLYRRISTSSTHALIIADANEKTNPGTSQ